MTTRKPKKKRELVARLPDPPDPDKADVMAEMVLSASVNAAAVTVEYAKAPFGEQDIGALVAGLSTSIQDVWDGDLKRAEAMLYGQANALQAIFTNLARRSIAQEYLKQMEAFLRLALKAQSQCRATLETLATIKAGPAIFARQANIAHGPQQVNNGVAANNAHTPARARENETAKTELLGVSNGERLDAGTASAAGRSDPALATVGEVDGTTDRRG